MSGLQGPILASGAMLGSKEPSLLPRVNSKVNWAKTTKFFFLGGGPLEQVAHFTAVTRAPAAPISNCILGVLWAPRLLPDHSARYRSLGTIFATVARKSPFNRSCFLQSLFEYDHLQIVV